MFRLSSCSEVVYLAAAAAADRFCAQGTKFDRIDYNIEQTVQETSEAVKQLVKVRIVSFEAGCMLILIAVNRRNIARRKPV